MGEKNRICARHSKEDIRYTCSSLSPYNKIILGILGKESVAKRAFVTIVLEAQIISSISSVKKGFGHSPLT